MKMHAGVNSNNEDVSWEDEDEYDNGIDYEDSDEYEYESTDESTQP